ncbi:MAG: alpha/beta hydrolase [Chloroflexi bacterium]|nr:alpha/beta hydrolase [Chloroflexota bacterium]
MEHRPFTRQSPLICVPDAVTPAAITFGPLQRVLTEGPTPLLKELEVYTSDPPGPPGYSVEQEVEGLLCFADNAGARRFHLFGSSFGAYICLAFIVSYPERVRSLALIEPASINEHSETPEGREHRLRVERCMELPEQDRLPAMLPFLLRRPDAVPPVADPPPWMTVRGLGMKAIIQAEKRYKLDRPRLSRFRKPVYLALGSESHPSFAELIDDLARRFPNAVVEVYEGRSHLDPPHRAEPERFAEALRRLWAEAEAKG